uniref:Developmentally-regulated GTP-binding protein 2 n=1 Tax=Anopheles maculatus TaxID=74869 RepID=A0A182TCP9_9DIPT
MGILEKISDIEKEIAKTQKNKATEYHLGLLKAKLAKYRSQLLEPSKKGEKGDGFDVLKSGDARIALIGFPSVGKSTLLSTLTKTESEAANYEFTTLTCIPGVIEYKGANIQLLDLPGIIEGAAQGKGRGRQVIAVARTADLVLMMLDATKPNVHRDLLEYELESVGLRLNKRKPNIYFKIKKGGGVSFNATCPLTRCNEKMVQTILHSFKIFNAEVLFREDCTEDEFIDVVTGNRIYLPCIYVYNKIDQISIEEVDRLARQPYSVVVSCNMHLNLDFCWKCCGNICSSSRVYTKKPGAPPDFDDGLILRRGVTVEHVCHAIHRTLAAQFKYALVWGTSTKYSPQRVGISHIMNDEDEVDRLARQPYSVVVSCNMHLNLDYLLEVLWEHLQLIRVYTKKPGAPPDFDDGLILRRGVTVEHVCHAIHRTLAAQFKYALVWGTSTKYSPQRVGISHIMNDEDVIQVVKK